MTDTLQAPSLRLGVRVERNLVAWGVLLVGVVALQVAFANSKVFPELFDTTFSGPIDAFEGWARSNRRTHPLFTGFLQPITSAVNFALTSFEEVLLWLPWFVLPAAIFLIIARNGHWQMALVAGLAMVYPGLVGLWKPTIETLALMGTAVLIAVVIGVPLGVLGAFVPWTAKAMRPFLDAMQTIPAPVYFIPMLLFFGIGKVPATIATVIYALPPVVRLTTLGILRVPPQTVEASKMFGSSARQTLFKVQTPMAMPTIMTGINQTIMMALGIVVLATLLGAGGLGQEVMDTLRVRSPGRGLAAGLAIVAVAMVLDRIGRSLAESDRTKQIDKRWVIAGLAVLAGLVVLGRSIGAVEFPAVFGVRILDPLDEVVDWARDNLSFITRPVNDFLVADILIPARDFFLETLAWPVLIFVTAWLAWRVRGVGLAAFVTVSLLLVGFMGMWALSIITLVQVVAAVVASVAIAVPIGIWAGRRPKIEKALGPILDALQTIPSFVYIIPVVILFTIGQVPGIIASVLYAIVPGIRITALGIRQVPSETIEASQTFGATRRQTMYGVRIPLAAPTIMAGVNQVIMMVLAMVIIAGLVGGGGLGFETINAVTRNETGLGFEVGFAIVVMAIILDRLTQAWAERLQPPSAH
ncbi:MAG TPA: ABC transporter permease subunit [Acidimicrobiia bacterium]|nr:ABC transporter permease subunit [Acidimicrobiia bacterium]